MLEKSPANFNALALNNTKTQWLHLENLTAKLILIEAMCAIFLEF